jgi:hypothetical protein
MMQGNILVDYKFLEQIYIEGWCTCAGWADRTDLITDCESAAFDLDMQAGLVRVLQRLRPVPEGKDVALRPL